MYVLFNMIWHLMYFWDIHILSYYILQIKHSLYGFYKKNIKTKINNIKEKKLKKSKNKFKINKLFLCIILNLFHLFLLLSKD